MYTREQIANAIENCLDESDRKIIKTRFGIEVGITTTLNEIELQFGIEREKVREIEKKVPKVILLHRPRLFWQNPKLGTIEYTTDLRAFHDIIIQKTW